MEAEMNSKRASACFVLVVAMLSAVPVLAAEKAVNISLFTPVSLVKAENGVTAFRFNFIYGKNTSVGVIDLGLINQTTTMSKGLQWGAINITEGAQSGLQIGTVNYDKGSSNGLQWGAFNYSEQAGGLQLAFVNFARKTSGVQIGAINIIKEGGQFPVMIIANWGKK
jgi:hypothetical protein